MLQSERWIDLLVVSARTTILLQPCVSKEMLFRPQKVPMRGGEWGAKSTWMRR